MWHGLSPLGAHLTQDGKRPSASIVESDEPGFMQLERSGPVHVV